MKDIASKSPKVGSCFDLSCSPLVIIFNARIDDKNDNITEQETDRTYLATNYFEDTHEN